MRGVGYPLKTGQELGNIPGAPGYEGRSPAFTLGVRHRKEIRDFQVVGSRSVPHPSSSPHGPYAVGQFRGRPACRICISLLIWDFQQVSSPSWGWRVCGRSFRLNRSHPAHFSRGMGCLLENGIPLLSCGLYHDGNERLWPQVGGVQTTDFPIRHMLAQTLVEGGFPPYRRRLPY